ncbi:MAG: response regulator [Chthoniobacter sp.]|uniref:sensor histidine kinase n=1 Tax=Chthoniobacter sp. TaxID=2510640 RepID=UPI0032A33692
MAAPPTARILIVDDEAPQMKALCETLRDHDYETVGFTTGQAALVALRETKFDLLLTDLMMPGMDGIALLRAARETDPHLVGILMTGAGSIATAVEAMKAGALDYILKPFELRVILPVLSRALAMRRLRLENAELEKRVRERTAELEVANKELEAFSYSVSHDLRAPLRAIDGFSSILDRDFRHGMPDEAGRLLDRVTTSARRMGQLIDDLLRFSRLGRQALARRPVNTSNLVQAVLQDLRKLQGDRNIEVDVGDLPECVGDPSLLQQVFYNLLANAFKYTSRKKEAKVNVGHRMENGEGVFFIQDNGAGFDMQYVDKLFGVFQRLHRDEQFEGTGVGLSIVQRIVHRHGGRVWAEGELDCGATFSFTLPPPDLPASP